jgi:uncharacterized protein YjbI with pentapeptide repeats
MNKCKFRMPYDNLASSELSEFKCDEDEILDELCIFHHENYHEQDPDLLIERLLSKIELSAKTKTALLCIGYNMPDITINKTFDNRVSFQSSIFHGIADFSHSKFRKMADFSRTEFKKEARFANVEFQESFFGLTLFKTAYFYDSIFEKIVFFNTTADRCVFSSTHITKGEFTGSELGEAYFVDSTLEDVAFESCLFNKSSFANAVLKNVSFSRCKLAVTIFDLTKFTNKTTFYSSIFENPEMTQFTGDLSNVSFLGTDISKIRFSEDVIWGGNDYHTIFEEIHLEKNLDRLNLGNILAIYRNLRENYEYQLRYEEAGKFFIREMELKRKYKDTKNEGKNEIKKKNWLEQNLSFFGIYYWLSQYGESYTRPFLWSIPILISSWLYWTGNLPVFHPSHALTYHKALDQSVAAFLQLKSDTSADIFFRVLSAPILGTLFIAFRRRFERRFRH